MSENERRAEFIQGLRDFAAFLEAQPAVPAPCFVSMNSFVSGREEIAKQIRLSSWEKVYNKTLFSLRKHFGRDVMFDITTTRATVCERIVTGQEVIPATPEQVVDVVEWRCADSLLASEPV